MIFGHKKGQKYHNSKVERDGITFDSKKEGDAYAILKNFEDGGFIQSLELQPTYEIIPKITEKYVKHLKTKDKVCERCVYRATTYTADFRFTHDGCVYVVDVKASPSMLPHEYVLKKKLMRHLYGIDITEVFKLSDLNRFGNG
jgi:hypothetical protein